MSVGTALHNSRAKCSRGAHGDLQGAPAYIGSLKRLSDSDLIKKLKKCRGAERAVLVKILRCINEVEQRRLYVPRGYASLYEFCTDVLKYSRSAAMRRIHAARCIDRFPQVAAMLSSGELSLTVVSIVSPILTDGNAGEIISYIKGRSTRDVEMLVSRHRPESTLRDRVRPVCLMVPKVDKNDSSRFPGAGKKLSQAVDNKQDKNRGLCSGITGADRNSPGVDDSPSPSIPEGASAATDPPLALGEGEDVERVVIKEKYKLEFAVDPAFMEKLKTIRSLLSTKHPRGMSFETLFEIVMDEYLERHNPQRRIERRKKRSENPEGRDNNKPGGHSNGPRPGPDARSRHIPQAIRDQVFARDGGRCTFVGPDGTRCNSTWDLEIDHVIPYAKEGDHSPGNLRILCARHNKLEAERAYGRDHMNRFHKRE